MGVFPWMLRFVCDVVWVVVCWSAVISPVNHDVTVCLVMNNSIVLSCVLTTVLCCFDYR